MTGYLPLIVGMAIVTFLPRLIPMMILKDRPIDPKLEQFLIYIPFTSLSILIIRGIMESSSEIFLATVVGIGVAGIVSWIKENLVLSVLAGILGSLIMLNIF